MNNKTIKNNFMKKVSFSIKKYKFLCLDDDGKIIHNLFLPL